MKPWMFEQAAVLMRAKKADRAVCLMDISDDWGKEYDIALYEQTYDAAIDFAKEFPDTAWCYGNHDLSYLWHRLRVATVQWQLTPCKENYWICGIHSRRTIRFAMSRK